jgi:hypothetical protein
MDNKAILHDHQTTGPVDYCCKKKIKGDKNKQGYKARTTTKKVTIDLAILKKN